MAGHQPAGRGTPTLWFNPPDDRQGALILDLLAHLLAVVGLVSGDGQSLPDAASRLTAEAVVRRCVWPITLW